MFNYNWFLLEFNKNKMEWSWNVGNDWCKIIVLWFRCIIYGPWAKLANLSIRSRGHLFYNVALFIGKVTSCNEYRKLCRTCLVWDQYCRAEFTHTCLAIAIEHGVQKLDYYWWFDYYLLLKIFFPRKFYSQFYFVSLYLIFIYF